jgi:hypothetical protein
MWRIVRRFPGSLAALLLASLVSAAFGIALFENHREFFDPFPKFLRQTVLAPGIFWLYAVGTFTGSPVYAFAAFVVGTFAVYLVVGLAVDGIWWAVRRWSGRRTGAAGQSGLAGTGSTNGIGA